jgi:hypothetical protein
MTATTTAFELPLELDYRAADALEVWLFWAPRADRLFVVVHDATVEDYFEFDVDRDQALDAFRHPYAYASFRRVRHLPKEGLAA